VRHLSIRNGAVSRSRGRRVETLVDKKLGERKRERERERERRVRRDARCVPRGGGFSSDWWQEKLTKSISVGGAASLPPPPPQEEEKNLCFLFSYQTFKRKKRKSSRLFLKQCSDPPTFITRGALAGFHPLPRDETPPSGPTVICPVLVKLLLRHGRWECETDVAHEYAACCFTVPDGVRPMSRGVTF